MAVFLARREMEDGEELLLVGPEARRQETGGSGKSGEAFDGMFVGKFGDDFLAVGKMELAVAEVDDLLTFAQQMHLDARSLVVVDRAMLPARQIEVRAKLAVRPHEHVEVELRGHAGAIVVGRFQDVAWFLEVDADDQPAAMPAKTRDAF